MFGKKGLFLVVALSFLVSGGIVPSVSTDSHAQVKQDQAAVERININTASQGELTKLKKIGPAYADRIIQYREKHGPFQKPDDITKVKGIGQKTWEVNKDVITVD
jgi:competence protein ComEA